MFASAGLAHGGVGHHGPGAQAKLVTVIAAEPVDQAAGRSRIVLLASACVVVPVVLSYTGTPAYVYLPILAAGALISCALPIEWSILAYVSTLGVQVFAANQALRIGVGDFFLAAAAARMILGGEPWLRRSSLTGPVLLFLAALAVANVVGAMVLRSVSSYVILNKDLGALYLAVGVVTLTWGLRDSRMIRRALGGFVIGTSLANATSLIGAALALSGIRNPLYLTGNMRLYGWTMNPNLFASVLLMAALVELAMLSGASRQGRTALRWANVWLLAAGILLTLSRASWLAVGAGAAALLALQMWSGAHRVSARRTAVVAAWAILWAVALGGLVLAGALSAPARDGSEYALQLRTRFMEECRANPARDACADVELGAPESAEAPAGTDLPELLPDPSGQTDVRNAATQLASSRGVDDRLAILRVAAADYTATPLSIAVGAGLDTFRSRAADRFGLPLIIHNTFAWALFEMGPLGLAAVLWLWGRTALNLIQSIRAADWRFDLAAGLLASLVGLTVFCLLNDGMYERHLWLLFVAADRLTTPQISSSATG
jgi:hypothetical protein